MPGRLVTVFLVIFSFAGILFHFKALSFFSVDDAFISFRYAQNFIHGNGLVFNPGERVEGYTNFLWIILLSPLMKAGIHPLTAARILGFGSALLLMACVLFFSYRQGSGPFPIRTAAGLFSASCGGFAAWAAGGLETLLFTLFIFSGAALAATGGRNKISHAGASAFLLALGALTRPEGVMISAAVFLYLLVRLSRGAVSKKFILAWLFILAGILFPYHLWRIHYFGDFLPNTYYVKTGGGWTQRAHGLHYLTRFFRTAGLPLLFLPLLLLPSGEKRRWTGYFFYLACVMASGVVYVGGDWMLMYRFFIPMLPFLFLLIQESYAKTFIWLEKKWGRTFSLSAVIFLVLLTCFYLIAPSLNSRNRSLLGLSERDHMKTAAERVEKWSIIGRWLKNTAKRDNVVAAATVGATAYYSELTLIDTFGMTDRHIARAPMSVSERSRIMGHQKGDGNYVIRRGPDIIFGLNALTPVPRDKRFIRKFFGSKTNREIWAHPDFHRDYRFYCVPLEDHYLNFFKKEPGFNSMDGAE